MTRRYFLTCRKLLCWWIDQHNIIYWINDCVARDNRMINDMSDSNLRIYADPPHGIRPGMGTIYFNLISRDRRQCRCSSR